MSNDQPASGSPPDDRDRAFEAIFVPAYRQLLDDAIFAGATPEEAEDCLQQALKYVYEHWEQIENPRAYARKATISNLIKSRQRGPGRLLDKQIQQGDYWPEGAEDPGLTVWEQEEWVSGLLDSLPLAQREVMTYVLAEFSTGEIAGLLGKTEASVRQNLCAARKNLRRRLAAEGIHVRGQQQTDALAASSMERR